MLALLLLGAPPLAAQESGGAIAGTVLSAAAEPVPGVVVEALRTGADAPSRMAETDSLGRFTLRDLAAGRYEVRARRIGFRNERRMVEVRGGETTTIGFRLTETALALDSLEVATIRLRSRLRAEPGVTVRELDADDLKRIPGFAEADVLRAIEALPGVVSTSDFSAAFNVRGGAADQNLILVDGLPIYNPFHLGGVFSVFNSDMVRRAELLAGGFPAEYGGRVSSVLNVESDPGPEDLHASAGISLLAARIAVGGALPDEAAARLGGRAARGRLSARRSYFDLLLRPVTEVPYHLTDIQGFAEATTADGGRFTLTGWTHRLDAGALRIRAGFSRFRTAIRFPDFDDTRFGSRISQLLIRADIDLPAPSRSLDLHAGVQGDRIGFDNYAESGGTSFGGGRGSGWLAGAFFQARWRPSDDWLIEAGGRGDGWFPAAADRTAFLSPRVAVKRFLAGGEGALLRGTGRSYGADLLLRRDAGRGVNGWIAASWVRTLRTFPDPLSPLDPRPEITYPPIFDRRIDIDRVLNLPLPWNLDGGIHWNLGTGLPYTRPLASYAYLDYSPLYGQIIPPDATDGDPVRAVVLGPRNAVRYPAYHRLDASLRRAFEPRWGRLTPYISVLNVYNRRNVLFYFYEFDETPARRTGISMFPVLPTLGVEVAF